MEEVTKIYHMCPHCGRQYQKKGYYNRHIITCELLSKSVRERNKDIEDINETPSLHDVYLMVLELGKQYSSIEKKLDNVNKYIESKKKRLNIIDWLNTDHILDTDYHVWKNSIEIDQKHLELVLKYGYVEGLFYIIQDVMPLQEEKTLPIRAFDQKQNTFFIYEEEKRQWKIMTVDIFEEFTSGFSKKIIKEFKKWQDKYSKEMEKDKFIPLFTENVKKVMGGGMSEEKINSQIRGKMYQYLKENLKNIVQFEFV
jgi:hypothetical protein